MYLSWIYALSVVLVGLTLPIFSYLTLIYRELGRMTTGRVHEHLDIFEAEIEPKLKINRRSGGRTFRILGHFWLAFLVLETTRGVVYFVPSTWESLIEFCVFVILEVVFAMHFIPDMLLYRTTGRWLLPLLPLIRSAMWLVWPVRVFLEGAESLARISEQEAEKTEEQRTEEGIEELVKPVLFMPETKIGSELLREMRQKGHPLAVVIDEHGTVAGIATVEDLVEEIVGESGNSGKPLAPDVVREPDGGLVMRGSMAIDAVEELLGVRFGEEADETVTTLAGLLNHVTGKVPASGDKIEMEGHRFEVVEANQRKVLRVRIRKQMKAVPTTT